MEKEDAVKDVMQQEKDMEQNEPKQEEEFDLKREALSWILTILFAFLFALCINRFIIVNANVPTGSMENTIQPKDRLIGWRLAYINEEPKRGDIIIFRYPVDEHEIYIKRVIGLPGEKLTLRDGGVYINDSDKPLEEDYLKEEWMIANDGMSWQIPEDCFFVMGDNRNNSADGRYWAAEAIREGIAADYDDAVRRQLCFVNKKQIMGKAVFRYFPKLKTFPDVNY